MRFPPALLVLAVVLAAPGARAGDDPIGSAAYALYDDQWRHAGDTLEIPWTAMAYAFETLGYESELPSEGAAGTRQAFAALEASTRPTVDPAARLAVFAPGRVVDAYVPWAVEAEGAVRDATFDAAAATLELLVWHNPPVACFAATPGTCGWPTAVCILVWPAGALVWALEGASAAAPAMCLPPTDANCAPGADPARCRLPPVALPELRPVPDPLEVLT